MKGDIMGRDYYIDQIMGEWVYDKKKSTKENLYYKRSAKVELHKDYAMPWTCPDSFKKYKVYGDVVLTETKLVEIKSSNQSFFRGIELTDKSVTDLVI